VLVLSLLLPIIHHVEVCLVVYEHAHAWHLLLSPERSQASSIDIRCKCSSSVDGVGILIMLLSSLLLHQVLLEGEFHLEIPGMLIFEVERHLAIVGAVGHLKEHGYLELP